MQKNISSAVILFLTVLSLFAQTPNDSIYTHQKLNRSLSFAQLTYGGDFLVASGGKVTFSDAERAFGVSAMPRATIGGLHFWGHADFYVSFPIGVNVRETPDFASRIHNKEGVETGMKIYPLALRPGTVRPYVGISFQPYRFSYVAKGANPNEGPAKFEGYVTPLQLGLTYVRKKYLYSLGMRYNWRNQFNYFESPEVQRAVKLAPINFQAGILRYIDSDRGMGRPKAVERLNAMHRYLEAQGKIDDWYIGIGPSTALHLSKSPFFQAKYPYLADDQLNSFLVPDASIGRYFSKPDINIGLSGRFMAFRSRAFETDLRMQRASLALEAYKYLFNFHGFVPFVGPMVSLEHLRFKENNLPTVTTTKPAWGIVFGWDIRLTQTGTGLLRTNLRCAPGLHLDVEGQRINFDHLEFNFIQLIKYLGRTKAYKKLNYTTRCQVLCMNLA